jgi:hypothetical protein
MKLTALVIIAAPLAAEVQPPKSWLAGRDPVHAESGSRQALHRGEGRTLLSRADEVM